jgi:NAD(P)-dependent dehydrogenase (short-subunit alcohol dehydrogenase family)
LTVLITGASSGIGRATAALMARGGWQVAATARDPAALEALAREPNVAAFRLDVLDEPSIRETVRAVVERFGTIDVLVNNAGFGLFGPVEGATMAQVDLQMRTNLLGAVAMIQAVMPVMRAQGGGTIINVSSIAGLMAAPLASLYHASKYALEGFSESFRFEAARHKVRVKLVEPGHFRTEFLTRSLLLVRHPAYETELSNYMEWARQEDRRAEGPERVARTILRAAEDRSARLRYRVKGAFVLALTRWLPDPVWRSLVSTAMTRRPRRKESPGG